MLRCNQFPNESVRKTIANFNSLSGVSCTYEMENELFTLINNCWTVWCHLWDFFENNAICICVFGIFDMMVFMIRVQVAVAFYFSIPKKPTMHTIRAKTIFYNFQAIPSMSMDSFAKWCDGLPSPIEIKYCAKRDNNWNGQFQYLQSNQMGAYCVRTPCRFIGIIVMRSIIEHLKTKIVYVLRTWWSYTSNYVICFWNTYC